MAVVIEDCFGSHPLLFKHWILLAYVSFIISVAPIVFASSLPLRKVFEALVWRSFASFLEASLSFFALFLPYRGVLRLCWTSECLIFPSSFALFWFEGSSSSESSSLLSMMFSSEIELILSRFLMVKFQEGLSFAIVDSWLVENSETSSDFLAILELLWAF